MLAKFCGALLRLFGWKVTVDVPDYPKSVICVAPHTTNWDFILAELAYTSIGRKAGFLMKKFWFFWPLGPIFRSIGGVAVSHEHGCSLTSQLIERFNNSKRLNIAITPEGTRSRTTKWHTGFLRVAMEADVPITLAAFDYPSKTISMTTTFRPTGDMKADMRAIKAFYKPYQGKYADKFTTDPDPDDDTQ